MDSYNSMFSILVILTGIYTLYQAFYKESSIYTAKNIKKHLVEKYHKWMKITCIVDGLLCMASGILEMAKIQSLSIIVFFLLCFAVAVTIAINIYAIDRKA